MSRRLFNFVEMLVFTLYRCFVNQHHGNVVSNGVHPSALNAFQSAAIRYQFDFVFACRAGKYFQQVLTNCHVGITFRVAGSRLS
jgi:hypothetical protein